MSNEYHIIEREDILEIFYTFCILKNDKTRAIEYISNYKRTKTYHLLPLLLQILMQKKQYRLNHIESPFKKEAFLEAIHRLETQKEDPAPANRMIWMFGKRCSTEMALGHESDNEFVLRVIKKTGNLEIESLYESFY